MKSGKKLHRIVKYGVKQIVSQRRKQGMARRGQQY